MANILLVDGDSELQETLRFVLYEVGYMSVMTCPDPSTALGFLRDAPRPVVVVLIHGGPFHAAERVLAAVPNLPPHAYVLLSTAPDFAPSVWNPHTQEFVPVIKMPFDYDAFTEQVAAVAASLNAATSPVLNQEVG
jgi:DNA-binding NtrC family response regulator